MNVLVLNAGSSSLKYQLFKNRPDGENDLLASGLVEKIGEKGGQLIQKSYAGDGSEKENIYKHDFSSYEDVIDTVFAKLTCPEWGVIKAIDEISAVGHRVVHGGESFFQPALIDDKVIAEIRANNPLAPLHNPANLVGIEAILKKMPALKQVAVFDTAFHQTMLPYAYHYALPYELYEKYKVRRYGFHGTSHKYVSQKAIEFLGMQGKPSAIITVHLGNGGSMAAVKNGKCVDTTMGLTPLEGLVMGTRSGDMDPAIIEYLHDQTGAQVKELFQMFNKKSGLKGFAGTNDMRELIALIDKGDEKAKLIFEIYCYRIRKYIGAYWAAMGALDAVVFTAGIGENSSDVRASVIHGLEGMGLSMDASKNVVRSKNIREIQTADSKVKIMVVPTNEELQIARETIEAIAAKA